MIEYTMMSLVDRDPTTPFTSSSIDGSITTNLGELIAQQLLHGASGVAEILLLI